MKKTKEEIEAFLSDYRKIDKAITDLYDKKQIFSYLRTNLHAVVDSIVTNINDKYIDNDSNIKKELSDVKTTRPMFAQELVAFGKAEGKAEGIVEGQAKGKAEGKAEGIAEGQAKGKAEGMAEGQAKGKAEVMQVIKLHLQKQSPTEISAKLGTPINNVTEILIESGLTG